MNYCYSFLHSFTKLIIISYHFNEYSSWRLYNCIIGKLIANGKPGRVASRFSIQNKELFIQKWLTSRALHMLTSVPTNQILKKLSVYKVLAKNSFFGFSVISVPPMISCILFSEGTGLGSRGSIFRDNPLT